ncbi:glycoside hydrolase family 19 protein [Sandaracinobacter neustonicus]|uniref:Glycoside hydrolase family 19 protein n=1 Tax=Sandaracinobacter neustonicus TaxID=1715348 RepID=A0A501XR26_9SPHN|nr:glycoside hydrolase family 19 protein [Sandaracinobacter neustonicus]TPE62849.1 glycoside hydrolase family 19 protein [Sandaracinobacter neustonicus]
MTPTVEQLVAAGIGPTAARQFQPVLAAPLARFGITTPRRVAAFLAQCHVESAGFTALEENLMYTSATRLRRIWPSRFADENAATPFVRNPRRLANRVYANRNGNGPEASGDGWRYRGRGLKQLTGRANYRDAGAATGRPYADKPDLLQDPADAVLTAAWFWQAKGCNELADAWAIDSITRRVNGPAMLEAAQRRRRSGEALKALGGVEAA